jgi:hypothetical protein
VQERNSSYSGRYFSASLKQQMRIQRFVVPSQEDDAENATVWDLETTGSSGFEHESPAKSLTKSHRINAYFFGFVRIER